MCSPQWLPQSHSPGRVGSDSIKIDRLKLLINISRGFSCEGVSDHRATKVSARVFFYYCNFIPDSLPASLSKYVYIAFASGFQFPEKVHDQPCGLHRQSSPLSARVLRIISPHSQLKEYIFALSPIENEHELLKAAEGPFSHLAKIISQPCLKIGFGI